MILILTKLSFVLEFSFSKENPKRNVSELVIPPTNGFQFDAAQAADPEAQILGILMVLLFVSTIFFTVRLVRAK